MSDLTNEQIFAEARAAGLFGFEEKFSAPLLRFARSLRASVQAQPVASAEVARLRAALQWYADGNHYIAEDWDTCSGEGENWLFPPDDSAGMIETGHIAKMILDGGHMVEDDDYIVAEALMTPERHKEKLARVSALMATNPDPESWQGRELKNLAAEVERYEKRMFPLDAAPAPQEAPTDTEMLDFAEAHCKDMGNYVELRVEIGCANSLRSAIRAAMTISASGKLEE